MSGPARTTRVSYDPLTELMAHYAGAKEEKKGPAARAGTIEEILKNRIVDGDRAGLHKDLETALVTTPALDIINTILLDGMKTVGELFGSGQMQLPFVLQSAEVMKAAVSYLEPFMEKSAGSAKGTMVIATVKGDVHDIGKNLVDIILTNNGYRVHNLGIKCPVETMLHAVGEHRADAIGMSGLLVKSTLIMKENLEVMNERNITLPVILGGAALTRRYVEQDLRPIYRGPLAYANDAFDGLHFMEDLAAKKAGAHAPAPPRAAAPPRPAAGEEEMSGFEAKVALAAKDLRPGIAPAESVPDPPWLGTKVVDDVPLEEIFRYINEAALFRGQWQVRRGASTPAEYEELLRTKVVPDFERLKAEARDRKLLRPKVVYGYFRCNSDGDDLVIYRPDGAEAEWMRFTFPRQQKGKGLCIADYFLPAGSGKRDVVAFHLVTMGEAATGHSQRLFGSNDYKEYLYFHGLSVECAEALAELWHKKIREELGIGGKDAADVRRLFSQGYQGSRYSFGYPACPALEDHDKLFELLNPGRIGVSLTEEYQLVPEQTTDAIIVHHPAARYFNI